MSWLRRRRFRPGFSTLRRVVIPGLVALATTAAAPTSILDRAAITAVEGYFNRLGSLKSPFRQIAPDGTRSTGTFYFRRPNRMRLDYDPPMRVLIIATGLEVTYYDAKLDQVSELLTSQTPLDFLLEDRIELEDEVTVTDVTRADGELALTVVETDEPEQGSVTLVFDEYPIQLRRWAVTDGQGLTTHIVLTDIETGVPLENDLFRFTQARRQFDRR